MADLQVKVTTEFEARFGEAPAFVVRAPGRVNLIGEHTDYNDGFVLPMAIDRAMWMAIRARDDRTVSIYSLDMEETAVFSLDTLKHQDEGWVEYIKGTAWALQSAGYDLTGWEGVMAGDVPIGSGLSSSAALEMATAQAFAAVSGWEFVPAPMAKLGQKTENEWMGVNSGIMDQMISAAGQEGYALLIDCRSLETRQVPLPKMPDGGETAVVILDTATRRGLVDSAYNERRAQCEAAAAHFGVPALRDVTLAEFEARAEELGPITYHRGKHVISENERTEAAAKAMETGDAVTLGKLMNESHRSLSIDFEVSSLELNMMVRLARKQPGCLGARMTGAGFGGCAVALVDARLTDAFVTAVAQAYEARVGLRPHIYISSPSNGAAIVRS
ncbi:MAG: galactokinase [Chloroflexota bacterium]